jgi:hypothetical protein
VECNLPKRTREYRGEEKKPDYAGLTEKEVTRLNARVTENERRKQYGRQLTAQEGLALELYWNARLKAMGWPMGRAEDTHRLTYMAWEDRDGDGAEYAWFPPSGSLRDDILEVLRADVRPFEPCGGGREVTVSDRFRNINDMESDTSCENSPVCRDYSLEDDSDILEEIGQKAAELGQEDWG